MSTFLQVNLEDVLKILGEGEANRLLSTFKCPLNNDVETFIRKKAIAFTRQALSRTYLIFDGSSLVGFFALANKFIHIDTAGLSNKLCSRISRFARSSSQQNTLSLAAPLIAQIGKNFAVTDNPLKGDDLLSMSCNKVAEAQFILGGKLVYLECDGNPKLQTFYERNGFAVFSRCRADEDRHKSKPLIGMLKYLS